MLLGDAVLCKSILHILTYQTDTSYLLIYS